MHESIDDKVKELEDKIKSAAEITPEDAKVMEFFSFVNKVNQAKAEVKDNGEEVDPCPDGLEDCDDLVCPECSGALVTVSFSLPIQVECSECGELFKLRDLIISQKD